MREPRVPHERTADARLSPESFIAFHNQGIGQLLGISFLSAERDRVVAQLEVKTAICTRPDVVHGGAIMALADCAAAAMVRCSIAARPRHCDDRVQDQFLAQGGGTVRARRFDPAAYRAVDVGVACQHLSRR